MKQDIKEYRRAYYQAHKEEIKSISKAWNETHKEEHNNSSKEWNKAHKEEVKDRAKAWNKSHKEEVKSINKVWRDKHREEYNASKKAWRDTHKEHYRDYNKAYHKVDVNSLGQSKHNIRCISNQYLNKHGTKIQGYQIHHCCTYTEPYKFIYCSKEIHLKIHQYLRDNNIDADSDHYEQIKHLLDDTVVTYGL